MDQRPFVGHTRSVEDLQWSPTEDTVRAGWVPGLFGPGGRGGWGQVLARGLLLVPGLQGGAGGAWGHSDSALSRYSPPARPMPPFASGTSGQPPARPACLPLPPPMMGTSTSSAGAARSPSCSAVGMTGPSRSGTCGSSRYFCSQSGSCSRQPLGFGVFTINAFVHQTWKGPSDGVSGPLGYR